MKVGINLLNFGPGISADSIVRWGQVAEGLGYHGIFISDHVAITPSVAQRYPEPYFDALTTLSFLAGQTQRIDLGTTIIVLPYRHPILLARQVANVDMLSGGRFIFGVGIGNASDEFAALGVPHNRRGAWSDEMLDAMRALWTGEGEVSFQGRHIQFERISAIRPYVGVHPTPAFPLKGGRSQISEGEESRPRLHPPIWVGGNSESGITRAVRVGGAWHPINQSVSALRERWLPLLRAEAERAGKELPALCPRIRLRLTAEAIPEAERAPGTGSLAQVHADLGGLEALGAEYVVLDWYNGADDLDGTKEHERAFSMLGAVAERVMDLAGERVR